MTTATTDPPATESPEATGPTVPDRVRSAVVGLPTSLLAAATGWTALLSWRPMADQPGRFTVPLLVAAVLIAVTGWAVRRSTGRAWLAPLAQVLVLLLWLLHKVSGLWLPRPGSVRDLVNQVGDGVLAAERYASPVSASHPEFHLLLLVGGIGILLGVDLLACGLRRASLAGLPLLLTITIAASVLLAPVEWLVFLGTALGWLALLALQESARLGSWGRGGAGVEENPGSRPVDTPDGAALGGLSVRIAVFCTLLAVVLTGALSSTGRDFGTFGQGDNIGNITVANPLLDLRRNLRETQDVPLVSVRTSDSDPSYLRLTVLDQFTGSVWQPSDRSVDSTARIEGQLPPPPGLAPTDKGPEHTWHLDVDPSFASDWLPLPYPASRLDVGENWRYDPDTLDVIGVGNTNAAGMSYSTTSFEPDVVPSQVRASGPPPASLRLRMTDLPTDFPPVFERTAKRVTRGATNDFDRAVRLQDWFRSGGHFTYSTEPAPGSGIHTLERFITSDRVGYCEQFSAAMAVMARSLHIPARVAVGFLRPDRVGNRYVFSSHDLHAWPELYFEGVGWIRFEPTPSDRTDAAPSYTTALVPSDPDTAAINTSSATVEPSQAKPSVAPQSSDQGSTAGRHHDRTLLLVLLLALVVVLLLLGPRLVRTTASRRRWASAGTAETLADAAWSEVRATAVDLDLGWSDQGTVRANGREVQRSVVPTLEARDAIDEVVTFVELTRYARPREVSRDRRQQIQRDVTLWQDAMFEAVDKRRARRARWWPRSVREALGQVTGRIRRPRR